MSGYSISLGRAREAHDHLWPRQIELMRATLLDATDPPLSCFVPGAEGLPHGWHWLFFHEAVRGSDLGPDGHEKLGRFIPDLHRKRRMWAGGRIEFAKDPKPDTGIGRRTLIRSIENKQGRSGDMWFVTLEHVIHHRGTTLIREIQELVYRDDAVPGETRPEPPAAPEGGERKITVLPDPVLLFRYSALTFNGHRIHYDADYARDREGYRGLVFHGPLIATLLMNLAAEAGRLSGFSFRATSPVENNEAFFLKAGSPLDGRMPLWAARNDGGLAMQAEAILA